MPAVGPLPHKPAKQGGPRQTSNKVYCSGTRYGQLPLEKVERHFHDWRIVEHQCDPGTLAQDNQPNLVRKKSSAKTSPASLGAFAGTNVGSCTLDTHMKSHEPAVWSTGLPD